MEWMTPKEFEEKLRIKSLIVATRCQQEVDVLMTKIKTGLHDKLKTMKIFPGFLDFEFVVSQNLTENQHQVKSFLNEDLSDWCWKIDNYHIEADKLFLRIKSLVSL